MDQRILDAALDLYGRVGWLGFNLDAVAKGAKVSKDALYRRWPTREALIADALRARWDWVAGIDTGAIREDLIALCERAFDTFAGTYGEVALQLRADARRFPEVSLFEEPYREQTMRLARDIVLRAIARKELPASARPSLVMDLLIGGITNHILSTPPRLREQMLAKVDDFVREMVDVVLTGVRGVAD
ncbi:MAG: TetR/AcrR family transcriptional regulator [Novosphingobium sp.]|nr:TetR/AcrR family transcriptional regulator [Novosphingobium sp.]